MIGFERPAAWLALVAWAIFCLWLGWTQATAVGEARRWVSVRFLPRVTRYSRRSLVLHVAALVALGVVLVAMVAGPMTAPEPDPAAAGRLLLLIDSSASMYADDAEPFGTAARRAAEGEVARFEVARAVGLALVDSLDSVRVGIASFSGSATLNLPITADRDLAARTLETLEPHTFYQNTGSSLTLALETVFHFTAESAAGLQVVLLGDGELPFDESYGGPLAALAELGVPVHAVAIGSGAGQNRVIYDFADVVAGREEKKVLRRYTTRRVDEHFQEIAAATGGRFALAEPTAVGELVAAIRDAAGAAVVEEAPATRDWNAWLAALALAGCLGHLLFLTPPRGEATATFELARLGGSRAGAAPAPRHRRPALAPRAVWLAVLLSGGVWACADGPQRLAHRANERALALDDLGQAGAARRQFELAASYGYRPEVPVHNLGRSLARRQSFTEAHRLFQRALELAPDLVDARFNDGVTLYEWGLAERDPRGCQLERTLELWRAARQRFSSLVGEAVERDPPAARAAANLERLDAEIAEIERLVAEPPPECGADSSSAAGGGGDGDGAKGEDPPRADGDRREGGDDGSGGEDGAEPDGEAGDESGDDDGSDGRPAPSGSPAAAAAAPLSDEERRRIESELERISRQALEGGKFYRRTREEQFSRDAWSSPEAVIWW